MSKARPQRHDRIVPEGTDNRSSYQRDRDRILYTSAFQRLAEVTQVVSAHEGHVFHNRLTHSLKVAQVGRRIAEKLIRENESSLRSYLDADVVEAAALAHDLGHPPFGHVAEKELNRLMLEKGMRDGFEGNAQSFRIVTHLSMRRGQPGLNLTRATLRAILKYPWLKGKFGKKSEKWGAYESEKDILDWARAYPAVEKEAQSIEAQVMDWADDVTYAVHDFADFFHAGLIPITLFLDSRERSNFLREGLEQIPNREAQLALGKPESIRAFEDFLTYFPLKERYLGTQRHRAAMRAITAGLIHMCVDAVHVDLSASSDNPKLNIVPGLKKIVFMLKKLTWHYVIMRPSLATQQYGQRKIIETLFNIYSEDPKKDKQRNLFPYAFRDLVERANNDKVDPLRIVCDFIASMSERQAIELYHRLTGMTLGSATALSSTSFN